jgi:hypothetical protein
VRALSSGPSIIMPPARRRAESCRH